jgi:hypothetical protein
MNTYDRNHIRMMTNIGSAMYEWLERENMNILAGIDHGD